MGGSVTGLTGTVVLQNNAGDDLTLTADGAFSFRTALANGTTYAVTIKTPPFVPGTELRCDECQRNSRCERQQRFN